MVMIRENRVGTDVDGEHLGQQRKPVLDFFLTGRIVLAGIGVDAAQKMSPNTATDDMIERRYLGRDESFAGLRHGCSVGDRRATSVVRVLSLANRKIGRIRVGKLPMLCQCRLSLGVPSRVSLLSLCLSRPSSGLRALSRPSVPVPAFPPVILPNLGQAFLSKYGCPAG